MEEAYKNIYKPSCQKALIITSSKYQQPGRFNTLSHSSSDGKAMRTFLESNWNFDTTLVQDRDLARIESEYDKLLISAKQANEFKCVAFFFVYYSGHGTYRDGETFGHTVSYQEFSLDKLCRSLARQTNTCVIGFFDCCRIIENSKGNVVSKVKEPLNGQYAMIFASKPGSPAVTGQMQLSKCTESFLQFFDKIPAYKLEFPASLNLWKNPDGESTNQWQMLLNLEVRQSQAVTENFQYPPEQQPFINNSVKSSQSSQGYFPQNQYQNYVQPNSHSQYQYAPPPTNYNNQYQASVPKQQNYQQPQQLQNCPQCGGAFKKERQFSQMQKAALLCCGICVIGLPVLCIPGCYDYVLKCTRCSYQTLLA